MCHNRYVSITASFLVCCCIGVVLGIMVSILLKCPAQAIVKFGGWGVKKKGILCQGVSVVVLSLTQILGHRLLS